MARYQAMSGLAMGGLLLGIASPAAMLTPVLWLVPWCGVAVGGLALWRLPGSPGPGGRQSGVARIGAVAGVCRGRPQRLGRLSHACPPRGPAVHAGLVRTCWPSGSRKRPITCRSARASAGRWTRTYGASIARVRGGGEDLETFATCPLVRTLVALGPDAHAHYYGTVAQGPEETKDVVLMLYAVTFSEQAARKTFFVSVRAERQQAEPGRSEWQVAHVEGGVHPEAVAPSSGQWVVGSE